MREIFIIGTIHGKYTPKEELQKILEDLEPDQVLVELTGVPSLEMKARQIYAEELVFAYHWAKDRGLEVGTFDVDSQHSYFIKGKGPNDQEYKKLMENQQSIIEKHSWKEFNNETVNNLLNDPLLPLLFNMDNENQREKIMLENIKKLMIENDRIVIVTGAGHLQFFESNLPEAKIPLRTKIPDKSGQ